MLSLKSATTILVVLVAIMEIVFIAAGDGRAFLIFNAGLFGGIVGTFFYLGLTASPKKK